MRKKQKYNIHLQQEPRKAAFDFFQRLLISKKAGRGTNLEEVLCHVLSNTPGLLLVLQEKPFPVTVNQTKLHSGIFFLNQTMTVDRFTCGRIQNGCQRDEDDIQF